MIGHFGHAVLLLFVRRLRSGDVGFQALAEVHNASDSVCNGQNDKNERNHRCIKSEIYPMARNIINITLIQLTESGQTPSCGLVALDKCTMVHSNQLEDEVGQCGKEENNDEHHGDLLLSPCAPSSENQESDGQG